MSLDGFLTFLTLVAALYALAPSSARVAIQLQSLAFGIISIAALVFVLYLEFFDLFEQPCPLSNSICDLITLNRKGSITASQAAFWVAAGWLLVAVWLIRGSRLSPRALVPFSRLVARLADEKRNGEIVELVEPHLRFLERVAHRQLLSQRLYDRLKPAHPGFAFLDEIDPEGNAAPTWLSDRWQQLRRFGARALRAIIGDGVAKENAAGDTLRILLRSSERTVFYAKFRPAFGIDLLGLTTYDAKIFAEDFIGALIADTSSVLYEEIGQSGDYAGPSGFQIPRHRRVLYFLLSDARVAQRLEVYRPIGEATLAALRSAKTTSYSKYLNGSPEFFENEKSTDRTYVALRFFDLMVDTSMHQGIDWHMWLYYFQDFLKAIVEIYDDSSADIDRTAEWPTRLSYLMYQIFDILTDWIVAVRDLPKSSPHLTIENTRPTHENNNIPKSAILCLGSCLRILLLAPNVSSDFKEYIADIIFRTMRDDLPKAGPLAQFREALINTVVAGGVLGVSPDYGDALENAFQNADPLMRMDLSDFAAALRTAYH